MKKSKRKQMKKWARWGREVAEAQRHARAELSARASKRGTTLAALDDDAGIETAIRKIHSWAGARVSEQDAQEIATIGALQRLQQKMAEALDVLATLVGSALDPLPETSGASSSRTSRVALTASDLELLKDPAVRRGYLKAQEQLKDGTWGLNDEQRELAKRLGLNREALAAISTALSARPSTPAGGGPSKGSGPRTLTPELLKLAAKMQITDPDRLRALAEAMANGPPSESAVMQFPRAAAA